jgi:protein-tyrosine phosphatase
MDRTIAHFPRFSSSQNGDLNWIIQNKILAFAGPTYERTETPGGYGTLAPADYIPYFKSRNVGLVVRLNEKTYDEQDFVKAGIEHLEEIYLDGSCPPLRMLQRVIQALEAIPSDKAFALHCRAGLGRTGTCIGAYMMKHYRLTAANVISWMRICRPGMVIGPQQKFLVNLEPVMWQEGEMLKVTTSCLSLPAMCRNSGQKRTSRDLADKGPEAEVPLDPPPWAAHRSAAAADAITGRPGQAEALLARRRKRQNTTVVSAGPSSTTSLPPPTIPTTIPSAEGPALITPDSIAGTKSQGFVEDDL